MEIKARFDEQANIKVGAQLEQAGVPRRLRLIGLKTRKRRAWWCREVRPSATTATSDRQLQTPRRLGSAGTSAFTCRTGDRCRHLGPFNLDRIFRKTHRFRNLRGRPWRHPGRAHRRGSERDRPAPRRLVVSVIRLNANALVDEPVIDTLPSRLAACRSTSWFAGSAPCAGYPGVSGNIVVQVPPGPFLEPPHLAFDHFGEQDEVHWISSADAMHHATWTGASRSSQVRDERLTRQLGEIFDSTATRGPAAGFSGYDGHWTASPGEVRRCLTTRPELMARYRQVGGRNSLAVKAMSVRAVWAGAVSCGGRRRRILAVSRDRGDPPSRLRRLDAAQRPGIRWTKSTRVQYAQKSPKPATTWCWAGTCISHLCDQWRLKRKRPVLVGPEGRWPLQPPQRGRRTRLDDAGRAKSC